MLPPLALDYTYNQCSCHEGRIMGVLLESRRKTSPATGFAFGCQDDLSFLDQPTGQMR